MLADANQEYAKSGWKGYLQKTLDQILALPPSRQFPPFVIATYYARVGKKEETLSWLERAYEERDFRLRHVSVMFEFDGMRSNPRFVEIVRKVGLPQ